MIDIHSHILPGIDDGSKNMEETLSILENARENGVTDIIFTPHYILGTKYNVGNKDKKVLFDKVVKEAKDLNINLYLGNEVFIEKDLLSLKKKNCIESLAGSHYILFELPLNDTFNGALDEVFDIRTHNYIPVLAHPERYKITKEDPNLIIKFLEKGVLLQCNIGSFMGHYGKEAEELAFLLLKHHMITFIGSDIHKPSHTFYNNIEVVKKKMKKYISEEEIESIFGGNALKIINDEDIEPVRIIPFKKSLFGKWK
jgi:protein-tyrosine phosphatase